MTIALATNKVWRGLATTFAPRSSSAPGPTGAAKPPRTRSRPPGGGASRLPRRPPPPARGRRQGTRSDLRYRQAWRRGDRAPSADLRPRPGEVAGGPGGSYEKPPPGLIKEDETKPEDCIPDVPGNEHAREFLAHAPTKGLWMPLGKEVKVMQCWRCKRYGHRTGDKACPFFYQRQPKEQFRVAHEDPMYDIIRENKRHEKDIR
ncbi:retinitis pigmentosa 9 protein [Suricata suricatta]|uniref:retinitis pigmentosa 9 protein n=1 Tax=Suricata suricatta TaxID=37032 RepID=UPI001155C976|nr:retinitis pigmentosa 9 protein [Suricata suricatta]